MGKDDTPEVGMLDSSNYWEWSTRMHDLLAYKGLALWLERDGDSIPAGQPELRQQDRKALALIRSHVSVALLPYLADKTCARTAWGQLALLQRSTLNAKKSLLEDQLLTLKKLASEDVQAYVGRAQKIQLELRSTGENPSEERVIRCVLRGLPEEFANVRDMMLYQVGTLSLPNVTANLMLAEEQIGKKQLEESTALKAVKNFDRSKVKCFRCHKRGHFKRDCPLGKRFRESSGAVSLTAVAGLAGGGTGDSGSFKWVLDSGATHHILSEPWRAGKIQPSGARVKMVNGDDIPASGVCVIDMETQVGNKTVELHLSDVLVVPGAPYNLLSLNAMMKKGAGVQTHPDGTVVISKPDRGIVGVAHMKRGLPILACSQSKTPQHGGGYAALVCSKEEVWHGRLGHVSYRAMMDMKRHDMVDGFDVDVGRLEAQAKKPCGVCYGAKQVRDPHPDSDSRANRQLELVHTDLMGPFNPKSAGGNAYLLTAIDDFSGFATIRPLEHKSQATTELKKILLMWECATDKKVKTIRSDRGGEYQELDTWCADHGVRREKSCSYTPQQNGRAERFNRTLMERTRAMLLAADMHKNLWAEATATATRVYNVSPRLQTRKTPWELFYGVKPDISYLRTFGCEVWSQPPEVHRKKLDGKSQKGKFLGFEEGTKGWRILLKTGQIVVRRNCRFFEAMGKADSDRIEEDQTGTDHGAGAEVQTDNEDEDIATVAQPGDQEPQAAPPAEQAQPAAKRQLPQRERAPSKRLMDAYALMAQEDGLLDEPVSLDQALQQPDSAKWRKAADEELSSLRAHGVYELVKKPQGVQPLENKWVLKRKRGKDGSVERYKARLVAKGFRQREGIDYNEVFAPVARHVTLRVLLAIVATQDLELEQIDVKTAFLNGDLEEEIYMKQPAGYNWGENIVLKLKKALYGLKQAARAWNIRLTEVLKAHGFEVSLADPSFFMLRRGGRRSYILIYVDDGLIAGNKDDVEHIIKIVEKEFELRRLGAAAFFLGMEIIRDRAMRQIILTQRKYVLTILEKMRMGDTKPRATPMECNAKISKEGGDWMEQQHVYAETVGMLMYLATCTRPDLAYSVGVLARFMARPRVEHWRRLKAVVQYLKGTAHLGLLYGPEATEVEGYSDSDYAADVDTRRSTTGYVFCFSGGAISWNSKLQSTVAASSTEAEYMAESATTKEALWIKKLMAAFTEVQGAMQLYCDNQGALALLKNPISHSRAKHIDVHHHFARERVERGEVSFQYCSTADMLADMFTKALPRPKFQEHRAKLGLVELKV